MTITVTHKFVSAIPDGDDDTVVRPSNWNDTHELTGLGTMAEQNANNVAITGGTISGVAISASDITGTLDVAHGGTGATTLTGYVKGSGTSALTASSTIPNTDITGLGTASTKDAGVALGVATLDSAGKVPISQIPDSVIGALSYQGTWNASTNTPTLASGTGTKGYYYVVSVAGTTNLDGITDWQIGDWAVYNGTAWQQIDNTDGVTSVNGFTGAVVLTTTNIAEGTNEYFTTARARTSISAGTGISYDNTTGVITNSSPSLGGDVVGPSSATDNAIARFDTTTGKLIQNSVGILDDAGNLSGIPTITDINYVDFNTAYATTLGAGQLGWDGNNTLGLGMAGGNVIQRIGEDTYIYVKASASITKGQLVMFTGVVGASSVVTAAPSTGVTNGQYIIGLAAEDIATNGFGLIQVTGSLKGFDTSAFIDGDILYYDSANTGGLTKTYPTSGPIVTVCAVTNAGSGGSGSVQIRVSVTQRLDASTGISVSQSGGTATITNTAPDQVVSITGAGTTSVTGTYPNFTITSNDQYTGTVTSVSALTLGTSGTDLSSTVANSTTTPVITLNVPTASATNRGALSAADWSTFNGKANSFTYTSTYIPYGQGTTTPNQASNFTFDGTTQTAPIQRASNGIVINSQTVSASYTIASGDSAMSAGPVTVASGQTVTVSSGSRWVVL